ncbi:MAG: hypothetical protein IJ877_04975 [Candidatus Gastranaerophilales bacterium]|nr:hypothetical protein [Candidatus Gastranaerophilales bacterium]
MGVAAKVSNNMSFVQTQTMPKLKRHIKTLDDCIDNKDINGAVGEIDSMLKDDDIKAYFEKFNEYYPTGDITAHQNLTANNSEDDTVDDIPTIEYKSPFLQGLYEGTPFVFKPIAIPVINLIEKCFFAE